jgi:hypothetical protein
MGKISRSDSAGRTVRHLEAKFARQNARYVGSGSTKTFLHLERFDPLVIASARQPRASHAPLGGSQTGGGSALVVGRRHDGCFMHHSSRGWDRPFRVHFRRSRRIASSRRLSARVDCARFGSPSTGLDRRVALKFLRSDLPETGKGVCLRARAQDGSSTLR